MHQAKWIDRGIRLGNQFHYRKKDPWRHNALNITLFSGLLGAIVGIGALGKYASTWLYIPIASLLLGILFFALIILVVHEASHGMFVIAKNRERARRWNRIFGWMVSIPFGINYLRHWEEGHHTHHIHPVEEGDPQTANLWTGKRFLREFVLMLVVPGYVFLWNPSRKYDSQRWVGPVNLAFWLGVFGGLWVMGAWMSLVAIVFAFGVLGALNQAKGSLEHGGHIALEKNRNLRSRTTLFPLRHLFMPLNISLHFEHHLNYCVPWYDLGKYHRALKAQTPEALQPYLFNTQVGNQLMGRLGTFPDELRPLLVQDEPSPEVTSAISESSTHHR